MANIVEYKLDDNWNNFKQEYMDKKEKVLTDIFESDYQGILDEDKTVSSFMGYLDSITKTHSK
jgi:hypothetical protein